MRFRCYYYFEATPSQFRLFHCSGTGGIAYALWMAANRSWWIANTAGTHIIDSAGNLPLNQWVRFEGWCDPGVADGIAEVKQFLGDSTTPVESFTTSATQALGGTDLSTFRFGAPANVGGTNYAVWIDDVGLSDTGYLGPAGTPPAEPTFVGPLQVSLPRR
jgi:hypothetical protein